MTAGRLLRTPFTHVARRSASGHAAFAVLLVVGAAIRLPIAFLPVRDLVAFVADDFFYYDAIARSLAATGAPSFDGLHLTNGFQPLLGFLWATLHALVAPEPAAAARFAVLFQGACAILAGVLLYRTLDRVSTRTAALVGSGIWLTNPFPVLVPATGVEAGLSALVVTCVVSAYTCDSRLRLPALALSCALAPAARVDLWALVAAVCLLELRRTGPLALVPAACALACAAPWHLWSLAAVGHAFPHSGAAVHWNQHAPLALAVEPSALPVVQAQRSLTHTIENWNALGLRMGFRTGQAALVVTLAAAAWLFLRGRACPWSGAARALSPLFLAGAASFLFYGLVLWYGQPWYFVPAALALCALAGLVVSQAPVKSWTCVAAVLTLAGLAWWNERGTVRGGLYPHQRGFLDAALELKIVAPPGAWVGAWNAGIARAFSGRVVVNLDGVVNPEALVALRARTLSRYLETPFPGDADRPAAPPLSYLTDQPFVARYFETMGFEPRPWEPIWRSSVALPDAARPVIWKRREP